jgi:CHAT domain-containing protein/tetratricopeptide (TPR) repeat protein
MINSYLLFIGQRHQARTLSSTLLVLAGVLVWPLPLVKAGGVALGEPKLVTQARAVADVVPAEEKGWSKKVNILKQESRFKEAIPLQQKVLSWTEKKYGPAHLATAKSLNDLADLYNGQGDLDHWGELYDKAETLYLRALAIKEKVLGPRHPDNVYRRNELYDKFGFRNSKVKHLISRDLAIVESPKVEGLRAEVWEMVHRKYQFKEAIPLQEQVIAWTETNYGPDHLATAASLDILADLYSHQGMYDKAESLYLRVLSIKKKALGRDHISVSSCLTKLARFYQSQAAYAKGEPLILSALAITEKTLGPEHPLQLKELAGLYQSQGDYAKAEPLYLRTLAISEKALGPEHPNIALVLNDLAVLYVHQGSYDRAETIYLRALPILEKNWGPDFLLNTTVRLNLGSLYSRRGAFSKAETIVLRALQRTSHHAPEISPINPEDDGVEPPLNSNTARGLNLLGVLYANQGAYSKAEQFFLRALTMKEKIYEVNDLSTAVTLNDLAILYQSQGSFPKAERLFLRALAIREKRLGPNHLGTATSLSNLGFLYMRQGAYAKSEALLRRAIGIQSLFLQGQLPLLPQAARLAQVQALDSSWEFAFFEAERSSSAAELALFSRLNRYGLLLEIEQRQAQLARAPGAPQALARQIADLTTRLADVGIPADQRQELEKRRADLERELYRLLPSLKPQLVEPAQVARLLPAGAVLLEYQRYRPFDERQKQDERWGAPRYLALVLNPAGTTRAVDMGPALEIDRLIARALKGSEASSGDPSTLWQQVNEKVFPARLLQLLAEANQWILAPDGELSRIPYAALPAPRDPKRRLPDTVTLKLVSSGRSLLHQSPASSSVITRPLVLADPDFGPPPADGSGWKPLTAAAKEGQAISKIMRVALYEKADATTSVLTNAQNPSLVHVASHGYYASASESLPPTPAPPPAGGLRSAIAGLPASREDAMLNSGIVLAGANRSLRPDRTRSASPAASQGNADDGYLTAKEAAQLQLRGTELVVLSACDTASGDQQSGEGLFGLQRALSVAGARSTLLSLWKVDDDATAYFMERYYTLLKQGKGRMEALLAVQEEFRTKPLMPAWEDYRYWAAFQLVGETGPINGL